MKMRGKANRLFLGVFAAATALLLLTPLQAASADELPAETQWIDYGFQSASLGGYSLQSAIVGNGGSLPLDYSVYGMDADGFDTAPAHLIVQRSFDKVSWQQIASGLTYTTGVESHYMLPKYSTSAKKQTVYYRLASLPFTEETTDASGQAITVGAQKIVYSSTVKVIYENQKFYKGLSKVIYNYMRPYCPASAVRTVSMGEGEAGEYLIGELLIHVDKQQVHQPKRYLRTVALHECAHEHQYTNWGDSADDAPMTAAMKKNFINDKTSKWIMLPPSGNGFGGKFNPIEHAADCAALAINPKGYLGYGGYCNPKELKAGKRLLLGARL